MRGGGGLQELALFAFGVQLFDEDGRVPLGEKRRDSFELEPALDEIDLGGLPDPSRPRQR